MVMNSGGDVIEDMRVRCCRLINQRVDVNAIVSCCHLLWNVVRGGT